MVLEKVFYFMSGLLFVLPIQRHCVEPDQPETETCPAFQRTDKKNSAVNEKTEESAQCPELRLDSGAAVEIAESLLVKQYGESILRQRPWKVSENTNEFIISGRAPNGKFWRTGCVELVICKKNAKILKMENGK